MRRLLPMWMLAAAACSSPPVQGRNVVESGDTLTYTSAPVNYSGEDDFSWVNDNEGVQVDFAGTALTAGSVQVTILDLKGEQVLVIGDDGGVATSPSQGEPGQWQVEVVYQNASGLVEMTANGG